MATRCPGHDAIGDLVAHGPQRGLDLPIPGAFLFLNAHGAHGPNGIACLKTDPRSP
jgi:hypothetical protein